MKYSSSALTEEHKKNIMDNIVNFMEEEKLYLENDMTITKLSDRLNISRTYVSQVINEKFDKTFSNLINAYRIKEARKLLSEEANKIYTIDSISKSVGFNSTNAFNKAFKKFTGVTPSNYIKYQS